MGALLDVIAGALRVLPEVEASATNLPHMADFSVRAQAVERAMAWEPGTFAAAFSGTHREARDVALEASAIYGPLLGWLNGRRQNPFVRRLRGTLLDDPPSDTTGAATPTETPQPLTWEGNMSSLLKALNLQRQVESGYEHMPRPPRGWPGSPWGLSGMLKSIESYLRDLGITMEFLPHGRRYRITDTRTDEQVQQSCAESE